MSNYENAYNNLLRRALAYGERRETRAGPTRALFGQQLIIPELEHGIFPILTQRKIFYKSVLGELAAFLRGATDLATYKKYGCNYWDANAAAWVCNLGVSEDKFQVGRIYGAQWRNWQGGYDQITALVRGLQKNPMSRRHLLTTYDPADLNNGCLPPCHLLAQFHLTNNDRLDCMVTMRSVDLCLGLPSDVILYAALLLIICNEVGCLPGRLIFSLGDTHIYENHVDAALTQIQAACHDAPTFELADCDNLINTFIPEDFTLIDYQHSGVINYVFNV